MSVVLLKSKHKILTNFINLKKKWVKEPLAMYIEAFKKVPDR